MRVVVVICLLLGLVGCSDEEGSSAVDSGAADLAGADLVKADQKSSDMARADMSRADSAASPDRSVPDSKTPDQIAPDQTLKLDAPASCVGLKKAVTDEIARIAACKVNSDCTFLWGICPFGCHIPHNKTADLTLYKAAIAAFQASSLCQKCTYKCGQPGTLGCTAGKCVMTYP